MTDMSMPTVVTEEHEPDTGRVPPILAIKTAQTTDAREEEPETGILAPDPIALGHANLETESARPVIAPRLKTVDEMVAAMNAANKRMGSNFKELCLLCAEAASRTEDGSPEREKLHAKLDFSPSKFSMLAKIGGAPHLFDPKYNGWIPPLEEYSKTYQEAFLTEKQLDEAVQAKRIHAKSTQSELARVKTEYNPTKRSRAAKAAAAQGAAKAEQRAAGGEGTAADGSEAEKVPEMLLEPYLIRCPLDVSVEIRGQLEAKVDEIRQLHPGIRVDQPLRRFRAALRYRLLSKATSARGVRLEAKRGDPGFEALVANTSFGSDTPLSEIARMLASLDIDVLPLFAEAQAEEKAPADVNEDLQIAVHLGFEAELRAGPMEHSGD